MSAVLKRKITSFSAEEIVFDAQVRDENWEFLDIGDPDSWCPDRKKFDLFCPRD